MCAITCRDSRTAAPPRGHHRARSPPSPADPSGGPTLLEFLVGGAVWEEGREGNGSATSTSRASEGATVMIESHNVYIESAGLVAEFIGLMRSKKISGGLIFDLLQGP